MEGVTGQQVEQTVNATDSEDALKYFPSLLVRKRYVGDYNHAVLSSRASGTGNSARSAVYADGILLSNYLGNGATGDAVLAAADLRNSSRARRGDPARCWIRPSASRARASSPASSPAARASA